MLVLLLALSAAGCGEDGAKRDAAAAARARAQAARHARLVAAGRPVFLEHCASCHTLEGRKAHPKFIESPIPNLDEVRPETAYVEERVRVGGIDMATFESELTDREIRTLVAYVAGVAGRNVVDTSAKDPQALATGEQVFRGTCARCHSIDGRRNTGRPPPPYPATDFNRVKPSQRMVMALVRSGAAEEMPSFRGRLTPEQIRAVAVYVTATAGR